MLDDLKVPSLSRCQKMLKVRFFFFSPGRKACIRKKAKNAMIQTFGKTSKDQKVRVLNPETNGVLHRPSIKPESLKKVEGNCSSAIYRRRSPYRKVYLKENRACDSCLMT